MSTLPLVSPNSPLLDLAHARNLATFRNSALSFMSIFDVSLHILASRREEQENFWSSDGVLFTMNNKKPVALFP